ncbi:MAG: BolA/IbaG family iron-sulfur metabolism protein [SAR324 cluster bacterium]|nr:BolA/IbaG family iron-sulfur metabolism protein [SAR324 cluster bacterium]MBL7034335.1 BolA/IbaG family iron-sulfur metabolism protein [SAR324 cluster bacterium]
MEAVGSQQTIEAQIKEAIETTVADSTVEVGGDGRHFEIQVISPVFAGKRTLEKQRIVYAALNDLMAGSNAPVHAIARLETLVPE